MKQKILYLFTRTPLHVGAGSSMGAIDQPIQRERHTRHPIIPGSSIKGVLRYAADSLANLASDTIKDMFGPELVGANADKEARAGNITFGEARPLAFPVRSAKGAFAYITCPLVLRRFARECKLNNTMKISEPEDQTCFSGTKVTIKDKKPEKVVLEEYAFECKGPFPSEWEKSLKGLIMDPVWVEAEGRLVLLSDGDFSHFVATTTEISQHVRIDPKTGAAAKGALFNIESVPAETLFFSLVHGIERPANNKKGHYQTDAIKELSQLLESHPVLQFGGNSTTGLGFCSITLG